MMYTEGGPTVSEPKGETYNELVTRCAYYVVQGVARGNGAESIATDIIQQALLWRRDNK